MVFVQYGCGFSPGEGWLNFDASPTLRIERVPVLGKLPSIFFSRNTMRFPEAVRFGDIRKGPLVPAGTAHGVYASHVLEHLSLVDFRIALRNTYIMLASGGVFRLIVPDLHERARRYVLDAERTSTAAETFMRSTYLGKERRSEGIVGWIRDSVGNSAHLWMWDELSLTEELNNAGFVQVRRCELGDSQSRMFDAVEDQARFFDLGLGIRECAMEALKPDK